MWTLKIGELGLQEIEKEFQQVTGLENVTINSGGIEKKGFHSALEEIDIQNGIMSVLEPLKPLWSFDYYLDGSFFYVLKIKGLSIDRHIPNWAGTEWRKAKYKPWIWIRK